MKLLKPKFNNRGTITVITGAKQLHFVTSDTRCTCLIPGVGVRLLRQTATPHLYI